MLDVYVLALAGLTCVLEIKSTLVRDHLAVPLEASAACNRPPTDPNPPPTTSRNEAPDVSPAVSPAVSPDVSPDVSPRWSTVLRLAGGRGCVYAAAGFLAFETEELMQVLRHDRYSTVHTEVTLPFYCCYITVTVTLLLHQVFALWRGMFASYLRLGPHFLLTFPLYERIRVAFGLGHL